jgi:hypothetical protein
MMDGEGGKRLPGRTDCLVDQKYFSRKNAGRLVENQSREKHRTGAGKKIEH